MNPDILTGHFERIGAELEVTLHEGPRSDSWSWRRQRRITRPAETEYVLNVEDRGRSGERFTLEIWPSRLDRLEFVTADMRPEWQHLLLLVKRIDAQRVEVSRDKFLCGHDERHWFIASLPEKRGLANVADALEALKPDEAAASQVRHAVRPKNRHRRRNAGYIRQGEWFFIPAPGFQPDDEWDILRNEPLRRPFSKAHIIEEIYRTGGETVYVSRQYREGLTKDQYEDLLRGNEDARKWAWRVMRRNPEVYARGKVRHPDHKTIVLPFWHRVAMAVESTTAAGGRPASLAFLD
jgi:hypothetical protein